MKMASSNRHEDIIVKLPAGKYRVPKGGLHLTKEDSGARGSITVVWTGVNPANTSFDGGFSISDSDWQLEDPTKWGVQGLYSAPVPLYEKLRQLYVAGTRYNRTQSTGGLDPQEYTKVTPFGYHTASPLPLLWADPQSIEIVSDHTWVQHRCTIASVRKILPSEDGPQGSAHGADTCMDRWGPQASGHSPGSSLAHYTNLTGGFPQCQQKCCDWNSNPKVARCKAALAATSRDCYLLDRSYKPNFEPGTGEHCYLPYLCLTHIRSRAHTRADRQRER
jgi:hypothetical protein